MVYHGPDQLDPAPLGTHGGIVKRTLVIHGPNLNLLGTREKEVYGTVTLAEIDQDLRALAKDLGL
jgi:3-dehydroquinate dehydratase-2